MRAVKGKISSSLIPSYFLSFLSCIFFDLKKVYKLAVSTYQMGCLLLFNNTNELTKREIQDATLLLDNPFKVAMLGMIKNKVIETENEDAKKWDDNTKFTVNTKLARYPSPSPSTFLYLTSPHLFLCPRANLNYAVKK